jgi:hypothetical protein
MMSSWTSQHWECFFVLRQRYVLVHRDGSRCFEALRVDAEARVLAQRRYRFFHPRIVYSMVAAGLATKDDRTVRFHPPANDNERRRCQ